MDLHDFGSLIWALFIVIAVISSIIRSARKTVQNVRGTTQPQAAQPQAVQPQAPQAVAAQTQPRLRVRVAPVIPSPSTPLTSFATLGMTSTPPRRRKAESIFGSGPPVARGVIALEVLGQPRALRAWSSII